MLLVRGRKLTLSIPGGCPPVRLAAEDVAGDFSRRLGIEPVLVEDEAGAELAISLQPGQVAPECFELEVGADGIRIRGGDARGAVYGLYHLAQVHLGIDPLAFWTGYCPAPMDRLEIPAGRYLAPPPAFALRGWFINDEDLLRSFPHAPHGPYIDPGLYREIFRSALRLRLNLIVPASLIDALDDEEAEVIALAAEHGLLIGNHHVEPLGVFPGYQFRRYCRARGLDESYSWRHHPDRLTACWEAYIQRLASFKNVVWTIGYRGATDEPFWDHEKDAPRDPAGRGGVISQVLARQLELVKRHDPAPQATISLWDEGSILHRLGALKVPEGAITVFADDGRTQCLQRDFVRAETGSKPPRAGIYYHLQFSTTGPRIVEGNPPEKIAANLARAARAGCTDYLLINVGNVRPHPLGVRLSAAFAEQGGGLDHERLLAGLFGYWFGAQADAVRRLYDDWFKAFVVIESQPGLPRYRLFLDGSHQALFEGLVELLRSERVDHDSFNAAFQWRMVRMSLLSKDEQDIHNRSEHSNPAIWRLRELEALLGWVETVLPPSEQAFRAVAAGVRLLAPRLENHSAGRFLEDGLGVQATLMAALTATNLALSAAVRSRLAGDSAAARKHVSRAIVCLKQAIAGRVGSGEKRFGVWYAGEKNLSLSELLDACRRLRTAL